MASDQARRGEEVPSVPRGKPSTCPVCGEDCVYYSVSFSKEGTWCNHKGWVLRTGATRDDPPILGGVA